MLSYQNGIIKISVRHLVEFILRQGDITSSSGLVRDAEVMLAGSRIHKKIQKSQRATYRAEVMLKMQWQAEDYAISVEGRADGIDKNEAGYYIDEIKGIARDVTQIEEAEPLHLAQAKCYAYMYARQNGLEKIGVQVTYCNLNTEELNRIWYEYTLEELEVWFEELLDSFKMWASYYIEQKKERKDTIQNIQFPYEYREGQKQLCALVYQNIVKKQKIFLQAPTGVGKTISTIYPALKAMGNDQTDRIFYLTAKTITRTVAQETLALLNQQNLRVKTVMITAKEKICMNDTFDCNPESCAVAEGHFDRINEALYALLTNEYLMDRDTILAYASRYQVCPYELSFEAAAWADLIICDYNYVFDPAACRKSLSTEVGKVTFLIDEAHNLLDRAREMYSAVLSFDQFERMRNLMRGKSRVIQRNLTQCIKKLRVWQDSMEFQQGIRTSVDDIYFSLFRLCGELTEYFRDHVVVEHREEIMEIFFRWRFFLQIMEQMDEGYQIYEEVREGNYRVKLFCINPSQQISEYIGSGNAVVFFSATLLPVLYYKKLLCDGEAKAYAISSPFEKSHCLRMIVDDVTSRYKARGAATYEKIVRYLEKTTEVKPGNYMIFFPSYEMMEATYPIIQQSTLALCADVMMQSNEMNESEREAFLKEFQENRKKSLIALCVLGSIYSEGIDLTGERLTGVFIIGTGLPGLSYEREVMMRYFDDMQENGYNYAYRYPGIHKVLQAAGRVIRTAEDIGMVVLMDDRFLWRENLNLLSEDWNQYYKADFMQYEKIIRQFWKK